MSEIQSVGVIGLGSMGMGAAKSCVRAGLDVYGVDLNEQALKTIKEFGAKATSSNALDFADQLDSVLVLLVNAQQVNNVLFDSGFAAALKPNTPVMISATVSAEDAKQFELKLKEHQLIMLDAPVSGGAIKAEAGEMTVMASGSTQAFSALAPILDAISAQVYNVGEAIGLGATIKIIHQLLAGVHIAAGAEAMALAARADIPLDLMYEIVTNSAGNSWMFENRMKHVVDGDYTPMSTVDVFVKDLNLVADTAKCLKFPLPLSSAALNMFVSASNTGFGKEDDSAVIKVFNGINLPGMEK
ncbi:L-threonate dehydrogenase [Psychromonas hadalis]|uniref:L-threonate dehydrogenase n=1 Tax=Psychromonas hadalis TaxID=211669 RepID=UPI0003B6DC0B|nr:L-threonate dehydrogenase [Psychromonas hadalis]